MLVFRSSSLLHPNKPRCYHDSWVQPTVGHHIGRIATIIVNCTNGFWIRIVSIDVLDFRLRLCLGFAFLLWAFPIQAGQAPENSAGLQQAEQAPGQIRGTIVDPSGVAVSGAIVKLARENQPDDHSLEQQAVSDDDGQFAFENVPAGDFQLTITLQGFATQTVSGTLQPDENHVVPQISLVIATAVTQVRVTPATQVEIAEQQIKEQEKQRPLGFIPNFYVSYIHDAAPLTPKQKFELARKTLVDPVTFVLVGVAAGLQQADAQFSGYGQGAQGYAKRYGASYADTVTDTLIGGFVLPSLLKQDPRYFYKGTGSKRSRTLYALATSVVCKGDNGRWQANYSAILGSLAAGGISNTYYPAKDRGAALTFENAAIGIGTTAVANVLQEFIVRKFTPSVSSRSAHDAAKLPGSFVRIFGAVVHDAD
jgi:Carboxypeptidase regulatory-like domain